MVVSLAPVWTVSVKTTQEVDEVWCRNVRETDVGIVHNIVEVVTIELCSEHLQMQPLQ